MGCVVNCCSTFHLSDYDTGNGICRHLINNLCSIYEQRPSICNIEEMYLSNFKEVMKENEFTYLNMKTCIQIAEHFENNYSEMLGKKNS